MYVAHTEDGTVIRDVEPEAAAGGWSEWHIETNMSDEEALAAFESILGGMPEDFVVFGEVEIVAMESDKCLKIWFS